MFNLLICKLQSFNELKADDVAALAALTATSQTFPAGHMLIREGDRPENVFLLLDGWAYRYKDTHDGSRQIMAWLLPGDLCDPHVFILERMDHSIALLSKAIVVAIPKAHILRLTDRHPAIARAFLWSSLVDEAVLRRWLLNMGQRDAYQRVAHMLCELWRRLCQVGKTDGDSFHLPATQEQLADAVGLTSVHVNRVLQRLRTDGLIALKARRLTILDVPRLREIADFSPNYLHMARVA